MKGEEASAERKECEDFSRYFYFLSCLSLIENPRTAPASCPFTGNVEEIAVPKEEGKDAHRAERGRLFNEY